MGLIWQYLQVEGKTMVEKPQKYFLLNSNEKLHHFFSGVFGGVQINI